MPSPYRYDVKDQLRLMAAGPSFEEVTDVALNQIRQCSSSSAAVTIRLLETIAVVVPFAHRSRDRAALLKHAGLIARGAQGGLTEAADRQVVEKRYHSVIQLCGDVVVSSS